MFLFIDMTYLTFQLTFYRIFRCIQYNRIDITDDLDKEPWNLWQSSNILGMSEIVF